MPKDQTLRRSTDRIEAAHNRFDKARLLMAKIAGELRKVIRKLLCRFKRQNSHTEL